MNIRPVNIQRVCVQSVNIQRMCAKPVKYQFVNVQFVNRKNVSI